MNCRVLALLYGPHVDLHTRLLNSFQRCVPKDVPITLWLNQVEAPTKARLGTESGRYDIIDSTENVRKYVAMRAMMTRAEVSKPDWWLWFDDDAHITADDWWAKTLEFIEYRKKENICYFGEPWHVPHLPGQWEFIKKSSWFRGRSPEIIKGRPGVLFAQGSYWWLRDDIRQMLDWPDVRLSHNGGDTLLGEAIRQNGLPFHKFRYGVKTNDAPRRGHRETPAGSTVNTRR